MPDDDDFSLPFLRDDFDAASFLRDDFAALTIGDDGSLTWHEARREAVEAPPARRPASRRALSLSLPPLDAVEPPRAAPGASPSPPPAEPPQEGPGADGIRHEQMRAALRMEIEGRTEEEIAEHFGHHVSTIRQWLFEARQMRREDFPAVGAEDALAEMQDSIRVRLTIARRRMRDAVAAGDDRLLDLWMGRITDLEEQHLALLERIGAIDALRADRMPDPSAG